MKIQGLKISKKLKNLREQKKLTQEELAKHLGVTRQSIIALEQGRCLPSLPLAINFSEIFELPFEQIFCEFEHINHNFGEEVRHIMANDITPWSPIQQTSQLHEAIDRLFSTSTENLSSEKVLLTPAINAYEKGDNIIVEVDVPGIKEENLSIEVGDETLTITGERKSELAVDQEDYYRQETFFGQFSRSITLPAIINKDKTSAELKDGQLIITLPKKSEIPPKVTKVKVKKV